MFSGDGQKKQVVVTEASATKVENEGEVAVHLESSWGDQNIKKEQKGTEDAQEIPRVIIYNGDIRVLHKHRC